MSQNLKKNNLTKIKTFRSKLKNNDYIPAYYRKKLIEVLDSTIEFNLFKPSLEQNVSDRFFLDKVDPCLSTGDLIDLAQLDKQLTTRHKDKLEHSFSKDFYPYFFKNYQYASIVTQTCKMAHDKIHVIELCAVKPLTKAIYGLLSKKAVSARDKFIYTKDEILNLSGNYRKLIDQQNDELFYYPPFYQVNKVVEPPLVACIDIKIPIRANINGFSNLEILKKSRVRSINPIFQAKIGEKLGRYYINVALEDTRELFVDDTDDFDGWVKKAIENSIPMIPDGATKSKEEIREFIRTEFDTTLDINEIWDDQKSLARILKYSVS